MNKTEQMCLDAIKRLKHSINTSAGMHKRNFALMCEKKRKESERKEAHVPHPGRCFGLGIEAL